MVLAIVDNTPRIPVVHLNCEHQPATIVREPVPSCTSVIAPLWLALMLEQVNEVILLVNVTRPFKKVLKSKV